MKKLSAALMILMLGTAGLTACSKGSDTHLQTKSETQSQWGLAMGGDETEAKTEAATESGTEAEAEIETETEYSVTELDDVLILELDDTQVVAVSNVNVRSGPGTDYDRMGSLLESEEVTMTGICSNEWIRIDLDGDTGYVLMEYVEAADEEVSLGDLLDRVKSLETNDSEGNGESSSDESSKAGNETVSGESGTEGELAWAVTDVNIRKGPKASYDVLGQLRQGESVKVLDSSDAWWWKVEFEGQEAYVCVQYLTTEKPVE